MLQQQLPFQGKPHRTGIALHQRNIERRFQRGYA